jgi:hypothetical protein
MTRTTPFNTNRFGLGERETHLLISALNGIGLHERQIPTAEWLSQTIYDASVEANVDLEEIGFDLSLGDESPELPYEYCDLLEKVKVLKDWEAAALYFYVCGFFDGQDCASRRSKRT